MQGEADAHTDKIEATSYEKNLRLLIESLRTDLASPDMPFVIGQISKADLWVYGDIVREAQAKVAQTTPHCALVDTSDLPLAGDGIHYSSEGHMQLGSRFAQKAIALQKAESQNAWSSENSIWQEADRNGGRPLATCSVSQPTGQQVRTRRLQTLAIGAQHEIRNQALLHSTTHGHVLPLLGRLHSHQGG